MTTNYFHFQDYTAQGLSQGVITSSQGHFLTAQGLVGATLFELIALENETEAFVFSMKGESVDLVLLTNTDCAPGTKVVRTGKHVTYPCTDKILGKAVNPLGIDILTHHRFQSEENRPLESPVRGISERAKITEPFDTGILIVDTLLPLGKGQRELLLGDRKTGKSQFALDTVVTQAKRGVICIYAMIGKSQTATKQIAEYFAKQNVLGNIVIIATSPDDTAGLIHLTPFAAMTLAEYFCDQGKETTVILDDLTTHAKSYRQLSLLARRFPGRNAYPGDIFYLHSRLLERAGNFTQGKKSVSITCLPIAETQQADMTGYIQTNLMSMTDGHLYFDADLFLEGHRPAVHPFVSVTRVGKQTKSPLLRETISELTSFLSRTQRLEQVSHFGQELSEEARGNLHKAAKLTFLFDLHTTGSWDSSFQFFLIALVWDGYWPNSELDVVEQDITKLLMLEKAHFYIKEELDKLLKSESLAKAGKQARIIADHTFAQFP